MGADGAMIAVSVIDLYAHLLIAVPLVVAVLALLAWATAVGVKWALWRIRLRRARQQALRRRLDAQGRPYPPAGRGMCDACRRAAERVYFLPDGRRLCEVCYAAATDPQPANPSK